MGVTGADTVPNVSDSRPDQGGYRFLTILIALTLLAYWPVASRLLHIWFSDEDMAHGVFVPLVAGYAVWQNRSRLLALTPGIYPAGLAICAIAAIGRIAGGLTGEATIERVALVATIAGCIYLFFGMPALRLLAFVFFLLLFGIPIPKLLYSKLTLMLQLIASVASERILEALNYTVLRQGNILELAGQKLSVAEACSGIRSLFSLAFLVSAYLYLHENRNRYAQAFMVVATIPVAIFMNALRIVLTAMIGAKNPELAEGLFHATAGWVLSFAGFAILMGAHALIIKRLRNRQAAK